MSEETMEIPQGRIRALHGGQMVRVCTECQAEIADDSVEVIGGYAVLDQPGKPPELVPSYTTELDDTNYRAHWAQEHT